MKITKEDGHIEINITPTFYIMIFEEWTKAMDKKERIRGICIFSLIYERDYRLDRHNIVFCLLGIVLSFRKNVF